MLETRSPGRVKHCYPVGLFMTSEVEFSRCPSWRCEAQVYFLQDQCHECGIFLAWQDFLQMECPECSCIVDATRWSCYCGGETNLWIAIIQEVLEYPAHTDLAVSKSDVTNPLDWEFTVGGGKSVGQMSNYRVGLPDGRGIHVKEYEDRYQVHWDKVDPERNPVGHLLSDAPVETGIVAGLLYLLFKG